MNDERQGKKSADAKHRSRDIEPADSLNPAGLKEESQKKLSSEERKEGERQEKKPAADRQVKTKGNCQQMEKTNIKNNQLQQMRIMRI